MMTLFDKIKGGVIGLTVGDALGVPYEFLSREEMDQRPARDMIGYGSHNQPEGTWSDDSSLTFCLMESLCNDYDLNDIANNFTKWFYEDFYTARGKVFDIGIATKNALFQFKRGMTPELCGGFEEYSNGNGSLMRILPLAYYLKKEDCMQKRYNIVKQVSSITHGHFRSVFSCFIYVELARVLLLFEVDKYVAYESIKVPILDFAIENDFNPEEIKLFARILEENIFNVKRNYIKSSGYVLDSLEAALWCFLTSDNYEETVLKAVNLGEDTDTIATITGGLAGLYYGLESIPETWEFQLAKYEEINELIEKFSKSLK